MLMLQVPIVCGRSLSLPMLDEITLGRVGHGGGMLETMPGGHGQREQLVGPEASFAGQYESQQHRQAEHKQSRQHGSRARPHTTGSVATGEIIARENRNLGRSRPDMADRELAVGSARVVVLGGGLSGVAAAYTLARAGVRDITLLEAGGTLGGLAGSFEREGHYYPLGYHHILHRDRTLLYFLGVIGALPRVVWRRIRMLFHLGGEAYDLATGSGFMRFPMSLADKARFVRLMLKAFTQGDWTSWQDRSAAELVDRYGSVGVRQALFERLTRLKFELPCREVSGAWLGARLHFREGSAPLGYIPGANWTKTLCDGVTRLVADAGVRVRTGVDVVGLRTSGDRVTAVELAGGERLDGALFVSALPTETYLRLVPRDETPHLAAVRFTALLS